MTRGVPHEENGPLKRYTIHHKFPFLQMKKLSPENTRLYQNQINLYQHYEKKNKK